MGLRLEAGGPTRDPLAPRRAGFRGNLEGGAAAGRGQPSCAGAARKISRPSAGASSAAAAIPWR